MNNLSLETTGAKRITTVTVKVAARTPEDSAATRQQNIPDGPGLWRLYQQKGGVEIENSLVEHYRPLVLSILNRLGGTLPDEVDREDLYSAGLVGLLGALRKFNASTGVVFDAYARQRIRGAMLDEIRRMDWMPRIIRKKARNHQVSITRLEQELGRTPTHTECAAVLKLSAAQYDELLTEIRPAQFIRLDSVYENDTESEASLADIIPQPDQIDPLEQTATSELKALIMARLKDMPRIQQRVLTLYYLEGLNLREVGTVLKLSEGRICQIQTQAIHSLRGYLKRYENGLAEPAKKTAAAVRVQDKRRRKISKNKTRQNKSVLQLV